MIKTFKYIACCLVGVLALLPLQAQNLIRPKIAGPGNLWVNSYNGVLFFGQTDFETHNSAMSMQLCFYYNSSSNKNDYGFGLGFSMGYEMRYREDVIGGVDIEFGDGRTDHFTKYGDEYKAPAGVFSTLIRPTFDTYLLTTKDGMKYFFDSAHHRKVTAIEDRNGNKTTFKYQDTLLIEVKDAVGHTITLNYSDGLLIQASANFSPGKFKYEYDGLRRLRKRIDPMGNVTLYDYSRQNKLDEITDANGNKTLIAYNDAGMVSRLKTDVSDKSIRYDGDKTVFIDYTEPNNVYSYYRWDDKGRAIEKVGLCCGIQSTLKYDDNNNIAQLIDANGNATNYTYDEQGNMITLRDPLGYSEQYSYEPIFNQVSSYRDKNGNSYTFSYDTKGNLTNISGPLGFNNRYTYDEHGWQTMFIDANGGVTRISYNDDGTTSSIINPDGGKINYSYDTFGRISSKTDPMGNTTLYTYDNLGRVTKEINALGYATSLTYDKVGNIIRVMDAAGNITAYSFDALGQVTSMTDAMGGVYSYKYDGRGNAIIVDDPMGIRQILTYNDRNKVNSYTNGEGEKAYFDYDLKGNLIAEMLPNGNMISYEYDELDRLIEINDNLGLIATYTYDGNGNQLSVTDGLDRTMTYTYDELNRCTTEILPTGSSKKYNYDSNSNLLSIIDANGNVTACTYSSLNLPLSYNNALSARTHFEYDANGNLTKVTDAKGNSTTYAYDALNQNTVITFANGQSLQFTYDELGRIIASKDRAGHEFKYNYNAFGNLLTKFYPDGTTDKYIYDGIKRMLSAINKDATVNFTYDRAGRLKSEALNGKVTAYSYDVASGKRTLTYPSGMKIIEQHNARDLIVSIFQDGSEVVTMDYNSAGQKIQMTYSNGITTNYSYNKDGFLKSIDADYNIMSLEMDYDAIGNIIEIKDKLDASRTERYGYDVVSQLTSFKRGAKVEKTYQFDLLGNRIKVLENGVITNYTSNNVNVYTNITGGLNFTPQYDDNGNLLNDDEHTFAYDYNNKLICIDGIEGVFKYDALGRRIAKNNTSFFYVGDQMVEEVTDGATTSYLYGNYIDEAILMKKSSLIFFHTNQIGSVLACSNMEGGIIERVEYDVFGLPTFDVGGETRQQSSINNSILFAGREYDQESGSAYLRARNLMFSIGRFTQKDPFLYIDGLNDLNYVSNSPVVRYDPYGLTSDYFNFINGKTGIWHNLENIINPNQENAMRNTWGNNKPNSIFDPPENFGCDVFEKSGESAGGNFAKGAGKAAGGAGRSMAASAGAGGKVMSGASKGLGVVGVGISLSASSNVGNNAASEGKNFGNYINGLAKDMAGSTALGAAGGAVIGAFVGGVGAGPGAQAGAIWGAGTSFVGYTWGFLTY